MKKILLIAMSFMFSGCGELYLSITPGEDVAPIPTPQVPVPNTPEKLELNLSNAHLLFPPTFIGETNKIVYFLENTTGKKLENLTLSSSDVDFSIVHNCASLNIGERCLITLLYHPTVYEKKNGYVLIKESTTEIGKLPFIGLNQHFLENVADYLVENKTLVNLSQGHVVIDNSLMSDIDLSSAPLTTLHCGDVVTTSVTLNNDLNCPGFTSAITISGSGVIFNGNGKKISGANAMFGISITGSNHILIGLNIDGFNLGAGVSGYNVQNSRILFSKIKGSISGIKYVNDSVTGSGMIISGSIIEGNVSGVVAQSSGVILAQPKVLFNHFVSNTNGLIVESALFSYNQSSNNFFFDTEYAIRLNKTNVAEISDLNLVAHDIKKAQLSFFEVADLTIKNVELGRHTLPSGTQEEIGVLMYAVTSFLVEDLKIENLEIGLSIQADSGKVPSGTIKNTIFNGTSYAGINLRSLDGSTMFGVISGINNQFISVLHDYFVHPGTTYDPASTLE